MEERTNELEEIKNILLENQTIMKQILEAINSNKSKKASIIENSEKEDEEEIDPIFCTTVDYAIEIKQISSSQLQRKFKLGYSRACRIIDMMEDNGIVSKAFGSRPRDVLISQNEWEQMKQEKFSQK